jgi:DNA-binding transcriptional MerR regulator
MSDLFRIGALARQAGLSVQAIRLYERKGLLKPALRAANGYRVYDVQALLRLAAIRQGQRLGFSLREMGDLLALGPRDFREPSARRRLERKLEELRDRIGHLRLMENRLRALLKGGPAQKGASHGKRPRR